MQFFRLIGFGSGCDSIIDILNQQLKAITKNLAKAFR